VAKPGGLMMGFALHLVITGLTLILRLNKHFDYYFDAYIFIR